MKRYLIDTNVIIELLKQNSKAKQFLQKNADRCILSYVVVGELLQGARNQHELEQLQNFISHFSINWGSNKINKDAIKLVSNHHLKTNLGLFDALIAATALSTKATLVTQNLKHFKNITGLKISNPLI